MLREEDVTIGPTQHVWTKFAKLVHKILIALTLLNYSLAATLPAPQEYVTSVIQIQTLMLGAMAVLKLTLIV